MSEISERMLLAGTLAIAKNRGVSEKDKEFYNLDDWRWCQDDARASYLAMEAERQREEAENERRIAWLRDSAAKIRSAE
jgi:hypothetical protein